MILILLSLPLAFILGVAATLIVVEWQAKKLSKKIYDIFNRAGPTEIPNVGS